MNKKTILTVLFFVLFSTSLNPTLTYANFNKTQNNYPQSTTTNSTTIWVPDNYTTIQEAINHAGEGNTIFVRAGTYPEHVVVNKALGLIGESKHNTTIDANGTGTVVSIIANNTILSGFTTQNGELGIWLGYSDNNVILYNNASNNQYGIYLRDSNNNTFSGNNALNNTFGIYLSGSGNNLLSNNTASNNQYGIYLSFSGNNLLSNNTASNNLDAIYLEGSSYNTITGNTISNNDDGIYLYHSGNNLLSSNTASGNTFGIYAGDSDNNALSDNIASNNTDGIILYYSSYNTLTDNTATKNSRNGIRLSSSSNNLIFHNNFINNTKPLSSTPDSVNSWDNGVEGNFWSDYPSTDANQDGIGDTPYPIDKNTKDNYPLIATFLKFNIATKGEFYNIYVVCNSAISNFQYRYDPNTGTRAVSFEANYTEGEGFCRINIPHALIEPPYTVTVDNNPPFYFKIVYTNGTHTWLYFTYDPTEHEITITHTFSLEQLIVSRWTILGLTTIIAILLIISIHYYRMFRKQKKVIQAYERELGSFPVSHPERARMRFIKDVIEREEKIEKFKKKYGIKIQPSTNFEDLMNKMGIEKEKDKVKH